jgi:adenosylcobinamide-GDP ribazoletransferase
MSSIMKDWLDDLRCAVAFLTRVPMPHPDGPTPANFARAYRVFPLVGGCIGLVIGVVHIGLIAIHLPSLAAAALALGAGIVLTGALHEDGLADVADGFGGGSDRAAKLEIMRDSRLGTYGALALLISFAAKASALAALPRAWILPSLIAAHAIARVPPIFMAVWMLNARADGLAATAGRPDAPTAATAAFIAMVIALLLLPWLDALAAALLAVGGALVIAVLAQRQIGGATGDVLGAAEQIGETAILLLFAASLARALP